jgi:hypothetical protein
MIGNRSKKYFSETQDVVKPLGAIQNAINDNIRVVEH